MILKLSPTRPDEQWHIDLMYLWVAGRWYFFVAVLDAYSRYIVHWELLTSMLAQDVVAVAHAALLLVPGATPRIVHDRGSQFTGKDFRTLVKYFALEDIKIRVNHPQSNGLYERFNGSTRREGIGDIDARSLPCARSPETMDRALQHATTPLIAGLSPTDGILPR